MKPDRHEEAAREIVSVGPLFAAETTLEQIRALKDKIAEFGHAERKRALEEAARVATEQAEQQDSLVEAQREKELGESTRNAIKVEADRVRAKRFVARRIAASIRALIDKEG